MDSAKERKNLSDVIGRHTALKRRGRELVGICPFHEEKSPSFEVNDAKGVFYCHGCGAFGDHFTVLKELDGLTFRDAYTALTNETFPDVDPAQRARAIEEDAAARRAAIADAQMMWSHCVDPAGTPAETYLRGCRGITMDLPAAVRFGVVPTGRDENGQWKRPYPAVVLACTDVAGTLTGLQRIFVRDDGSGKRFGKASKLSLGRPRGSAVHLRDGGGEAIMCEGPEDGLTLAQEFRDHPVWVALGTAMMPEMRLPPSVRQLTLAGQNDRAGRTAVEKTRAAFVERGLAVRLMFPDEAYKDWNDQLRGVRA